jgi:hypothetical protein
MCCCQQQQPLDPEEVIRDLLNASEFAILHLTVFALLIAVIHGDVRRSTWVSLALLPVPVLGLQL